MKISIAILILLTASATAAAFALQDAHKDDSAALVKALSKSKHSLTEGIRQVSKAPETAISAKFEFDDNGKLSLSIYTAEKGLGMDAEHNVLKEYSGSPEAAAWAPSAEVFKDVAHVARSAQQHTLMALTKLSMLDVIANAEKDTKGQILSITPLVSDHEAYFAVQAVVGDKVVEKKYEMWGGEGDEMDEEHEKHEKH